MTVQSFFQACRGRETDYGLSASTFDEEATSSKVSRKRRNGQGVDTVPFPATGDGEVHVAIE